MLKKRFPSPLSPDSMPINSAFSALDVTS